MDTEGFGVRSYAVRRLSRSPSLRQAQYKRQAQDKLRDVSKPRTGLAIAARPGFDFWSAAVRYKRYTAACLFV